MKSLIISIFFISAVLQGLAAQASHDVTRDVLPQIEQNNTLLQALRKQAEADKTGNKTGILPENPEIEYHYLWGNRDGNRIDFSVSQTFDFPTAYYHRKKVSDAQNRQVDLQYQIERKNILLEAQKLCIQLIYQNALFEIVSGRATAAERLMQAYKRQYEQGEINILEYNRAKINHLNVQKEYASCQTERAFLSGELSRLNGGIAIDFSISTFETISLPSDFQVLYNELKTNNLELLYRQEATALSRQSEKLQRSLNLPQISTGYMSEKAPMEHFQGITVGVSIPLWANKNTIKRIKAQTQANEAQETDAETRYFNETNALYKKAQSLLQLINNQDFTQSEVLNHNELLQKALQAGQISLLDYLLESEIYYELNRALLETGRDLQLTVAELMQWKI
ncbi:MAG: TolC family protein [Dysgonamonadaceae bacterium]|nr:TolC family protein [Dysgonamonadaceae bacterium]